jgi:uncharacterized protein with von Willebrand factor type A (vWA) domain
MSINVIRAIPLAAALSVAACDSETASPGTASAAESKTVSGSDSPVDACSLLTQQEWEDLLGAAYYGPERRDGRSRDGDTFTSVCTYNFTEVLLGQPAHIADTAGLTDYLERSPNSLADADAERGMEWSVHVEPVDGLGAPAVVGWVTAAEGADLAGFEVYYLAALRKSGSDSQLLRVKSAESADEARTVAERILSKP